MSQEKEKEEKESKPLCPLCKEPLTSDLNHSIGMVHAVCKACDYCPDCNEGNV